MPSSIQGLTYRPVPTAQQAYSELSDQLSDAFFNAAASTWLKIPIFTPSGDGHSLTVDMLALFCGC